MIEKKVFEIRKKMFEETFTRDTSGFKYKYLDYPTLCAKLDKELYDKNILFNVSFANDQCQAEVIDIDDGSKLKFESPIAVEGNVAGATPIQSIGAMHTYMRRYMKLLAFDIVIEDEVEKSANKPVRSESYNKMLEKTNELAREWDADIEQHLTEHPEQASRKMSVGINNAQDLEKALESYNLTSDKKQTILNYFANNGYKNNFNGKLTDKNLEYLAKCGWNFSKVFKN